MRTYRELFAVGEFRVLFVARCFVMAGVSVSALALGTIMYQSTGSPLLTALALFGGPLVQLVSSHFLLATADLMRPRTAIVVVGLTAAITDLLQLVPGLPWGARFGLLAAGYVVIAATSGTVVALLSEILPPDGFVLGRSTMNVAVGSMQIVGNSLGALLLLWFATVHLFLLSAAITMVAVIVARAGLADHPPRATGKVVVRTQAINKLLLGSRLLRPVYLTLWVPNGLVVGCEALFIPFAGRRAGYLYAVTAAGMLIGDVVMGRLVPIALRDRLIVPLRVVLAAPYLALFLVPHVWPAAALGFVAALGYCASLPLQERLIAHTDPSHRGQVFGLASTGMMVWQALGAVVGGGLAQWLGHGPLGAARVMSLLALASLLVSAILTPGLRRSAQPAAV